MAFPSLVNVVAVPGTLQALNVCQEKAGNHSYIFKIRRGRHFGYTKNKAQLSRLFPACALRHCCLISLSSVVKYTLSDRFTQLGCEIAFMSHLRVILLNLHICIQVINYLQMCRVSQILFFWWNFLP